MNRRRGQSGAALVELAVAASVLVVIVSGGLAAVYLTFAIAWIERESYEALICLASRRGASHACEAKMRRRSEAALPIGRFTHLMLVRSADRVRVEARFAIAGREAIRHEDSRRLPLRWEAATRGKER